MFNSENLDEDIQQVVTAILSKQVKIYAQGLKALGNLPTSSLIKILRSNKNGVKSYVITELKNRQETKAVVFLRDLITHQDGELCFDAIRALGFFKDIESVEPLIKILEQKVYNKKWDEEEKIFIRIAAATSLGDIGDVKALPALLKAQKEDKGKTFRGYTVEEAVTASIAEINNKNNSN
jgi:HEAT repeat protein